MKKKAFATVGSAVLALGLLAACGDATDDNTGIEEPLDQEPAIEEPMDEGVDDGLEEGTDLGEDTGLEEGDDLGEPADDEGLEADLDDEEEELEADE
ncbi:DNA primase [Alkalihalobacillus sp. LMS39]|uniref:DNA primase n=1 Tax=Alkalihalobacillus sp. LMS39 TaxID=2924032 RepID=UPI001FB522EA|nr:DNA primase [Alkalihalobacillus sp. LMS39]UOE93887.1 DNA primase [Alkalihalobacillus sp. LMS39]